MLRSMLRSGFACLITLFLACSPVKTPISSPEVAPEITPVNVTLVESEPAETTLDRTDIADAPDVWLEMFQNAKHHIDIANFYASEADPQWLSASKLTPILQALVAAHDRGVKVRFLIDEKFIPQYPGTFEGLKKAGFDVRVIKGDAVFGGVQHAKYFIVDGQASFVGSQNFDWRALTHIQEMGVRLDSAEMAALLMEIFETDWALAGGVPNSTRVHKGIPWKGFIGTEDQQIRLVASPRGFLPDEQSWELPQIIALLDGAKKSIQLQVLKYKTVTRSGDRFTDLDDALRRAAGRGVQVRLIVSEWALKDKSVDALHALSSTAEIRIIKIPAWSGGEIPFARVAHAKYLVIDGEAAWIGSSNWEGDYFTKSRNVGVILQGGRAPARLSKFFDENWAGVYTTPLPIDPPQTIKL